MQAMASLLLLRAAAALAPARLLSRPAASRSFSSWLPPGRLQAAASPGAGTLPCFLTKGPLPLPQPVAGFKSKVVLRKRCKDCYFVRRRGRMYVWCKTHPRHKQRKL